MDYANRTRKAGTINRWKAKDTAGMRQAEREIKELEATKEIIKDKDFLNSIMRGDEDFRCGRFKKWSEAREDV
ncbi:MAG: hypothetical protein L6246_06040 [Thermodesulfovibrionales bacterium]|nr:hypothetical protein [Nitrospinota bacterium]MCG2709858.1 hypothetical protein [Thermodesulfovibrionales bacterium]